METNKMRMTIINVCKNCNIKIQNYFTLTSCSCLGPLYLIFIVCGLFISITSTTRHFIFLKPKSKASKSGPEK